MKTKYTIGLIAVALTLYFWFDSNGVINFRWIPDGIYHPDPTPPPGLRISPYPPIVHPHIQPAATPIPSTRRPPSI